MTKPLLTSNLNQISLSCLNPSNIFFPELLTCTWAPRPSRRASWRHRSNANQSGVVPGGSGGRGAGGGGGTGTPKGKRMPRCHRAKAQRLARGGRGGLLALSATLLSGAGSFLACWSSACRCSKALLRRWCRSSALAYSAITEKTESCD